MKKIVIAILAIIYLFTSMGASIELHYCMGKFADQSLWQSGSSKCRICGMQKKNKSVNKGCCRDEYKLVKVEQHQRVSQNLEVDKTLKEIFLIILPTWISMQRLFVTNAISADTPERSSPFRLHQLNCVLRI